MPLILSVSHRISKKIKEENLIIFKKEKFPLAAVRSLGQ